MTFKALIVVFGLAAALFLFAAVRNARRRRVIRAVLSAIISLAFLLGLGGALVVSGNLSTYRRLSAEQSVGEIEFTRIGYHQFNGIFTFASGERADFALRGDEWQLDARMLQWSAFANVVGFDTVYRLDRISGRYASIDDERSLPRTVYAMNPAEHIDLWELLHRYQSVVPWVDALYGSATYLPMADGARYDIKISRSGLLARPANQAARAAVGSWRPANSS